VAEPQDITETVLGKSRNQKKNKGNENPLVFHEIVISCKDFGLDGLFNQWKAESPGEDKGYPRSDCKTESRIDCAQEGTVEEAADDAGDFTGYRGSNHLDYLKGYENDLTVRMKGVDELYRLLLLDKVNIKAVMKKKISSEQQQSQERNNLETEDALILPG
jgi:hypothetical protein